MFGFPNENIYSSIVVTSDPSFSRRAPHRGSPTVAPASPRPVREWCSQTKAVGADPGKSIAFAIEPRPLGGRTDAPHPAFKRAVGHSESLAFEGLVRRARHLRAHPPNVVPRERICALCGTDPVGRQPMIPGTSQPLRASNHSTKPRITHAEIQSVGVVIQQEHGRAPSSEIG